MNVYFGIAMIVLSTILAILCGIIQFTPGFVTALVCLVMSTIGTLAADLIKSHK